MPQFKGQFINQTLWKNNLPGLKKRYATNKPFPHIILDDFFLRSALEKVETEFPSVQNNGWIHYIHFNEKKHGLNKLNLIPHYPRQLIEELNSPTFLRLIEELTGIKNLLADDSLEGGGLHQSARGGFLNIHADFTVHPHKKNWKRRVNVLVYLNKNWKEEYNGHLELWRSDMKNCEVKILPIFNRCVIFNTDENSFHGFPDALNCPENITRKSIALYYFTEEKVAPRRINTNYKPKPQERTVKKMLVYLDKQILWTYSRIKSALGINDDFASKVLSLLNKKDSKPNK